MDKIYAYGHENILCTHKTTIELTKEVHVTKKGNCILGVKASKACIDLNTNLKRIIKSGNKIKVVIKSNNLKDCFYGYGDKNLTLLNKKAMVFRKTDFICDRTILIKCTKSSSELNRDLIKSLSVSGKEFSIIFELNDSDENKSV